MINLLISFSAQEQASCPWNVPSESVSFADMLNLGTSSSQGMNATLSLSFLLCNACGTSMLLCSLMTSAQCNNSCGKQTLWVWRILSGNVLPC